MKPLKKTVGNTYHTVVVSTERCVGFYTLADIGAGVGQFGRWLLDKASGSLSNIIKIHGWAFN